MENTQNTQAEQVLYFKTPVLAPDKKPCAAMYSISLTKRVGEMDVLRFEIRRDLSKKLESFTIRYRFSSLPVFTPDTANKFNRYVYNADDINEHSTIEISAVIPSHMKIEGCGAYISEIKLTSGQVITYDASEYRFVRKQTVPSPSPQTALQTTHVHEKSAPKQQTSDKSVSPSDRDIRKRVRLAVILTVFIFMLITEAIAGVYLYRYLGVKSSVDMLIKENRYNEAYKIACDAEQTGILQNVCEKAAVHYFAEGDLESSYVYAVGAPDPFPDMIIDYAAQSVVSMVTGEINENAFRVAKMSEDNEKFDAIIHSMCDILKKQGDYSNALRVASELRDTGDRGKSEDAVFIDALNFYIGTHRYGEAAAFIDELENVTTFAHTEAEIINSAIEVCRSLGDNAGIIYLAQRYPETAEMTAAEAGIAADDAGVRSELAVIYPLLTANQRRSYHAQTIAVWNEDIVLIESGHIDNTKITDAVSVDTNAELTLVLHKDGSASVLPHEGVKAPYEIPAYADIIDIALGESHAVLLHANGTVTVVGDNTYGQGNVSEWTDIVAIAAGQRFTVGLKIDGTVVAAGSNSCGQCDVSKYRNVVDIAACNLTTVMLFSDGTVMIQGYRSMGLSDIEAVTDVKRIRAGGAAILAETSDGKYTLSSGQLGGSYGDPYNWRSMAAFDVGMVCIAGIDKTDVLFFGGDGLPK